MGKEPIIIVGGEPNSVFLEIFFKSLKTNTYKSPIIIIISKKLLQAQMKKLNFNFKINDIDKRLKNFSKLNNNKINLINVDYNFKKCFEKITSKSNQYIDETFKTALDFIKQNNLSKFINGPVSKKSFLNGKTLGITEYLADKTKKNKVAMLIFNKDLSVSPLTTHLPLKDVYKKITKQKIYSQVNLINNFYKIKFNKFPRIAITGLNPHCESNFKNSEEDKIIIPAIKKLRLKNTKINGPFPADTIFTTSLLRKYDVIIGMYHDQVLSPMKALFNFDAINITLGLPFTRISPDHGPNYSMLGKNLSDPKSLIQALKFLDK
ncbi:4-hydroxythreonine-4-phosphate dehydrogenase [Candidatus Pelagibacter giovannonii]|uniref:4-hydroxythreonine-4-phosphate dehydrogenase n=1 Tax=Candidatus Pelagibacter giovannonii TaxID=2563896 RepID=A0A6H1Q167_9PROT|nr:4-hydroxythreonine-4-phosphate dehydrogenase PdxA [Candidatus Pelagibacter giovannonii]QIZ20657.1 4-hydroxythreonine-4-phosphate dehydrogenase [Candidatus Pelagibacter giovannonii]